MVPNNQQMKVRLKWELTPLLWDAQKAARPTAVR
jgi:hypothetical protein